MKTALAVFAKTPGLSPVKTRLGADLGQKNAEIFYRMSVEAVEEIATKARDCSENKIDIFWALPERSVADQLSLRSFPVLWTGEDGFGKGLYTVSSNLFEKYGRVIMIGTDSPQLKESLILKASDMLLIGPNRCVIGPCPDGGFYLFGSNSVIPESIWSNVQYSRPDTLQQLTEKLQKSGFLISLLPQVTDIDQIDDLKLLFDVFHDNENDLLPAQRKLYSWLKCCV